MLNDILNNKVVLSISGYLIGFILSTSLWGKTEGSAGLLPNLRFLFGGKIIFFHHWIVFLVALFFILIFRSHFNQKLFYLLLGAVIGGFHQGLTYNDWWILVK